MDSDDINDFQNLLPRCNYYTINEFNSAFKLPTITKNSLPQEFSMLHLNVRSLNKNFDNFEMLLTMLNKFSFSLIAITETWLNSNSPPIFNIPNYKLLRADRQHGRGGGVAIYLRDGLTYRLRKDIHIEGVEDLFIEMTDNKFKNKIIGVIYRPPQNIFDSFINNLDTCLGKLAAENKHNYLLGDFNIDLSVPHDNQSQRLMNTLSSYDLHPHIDKATRITHSTHSLLDNIFSTDINDKTNGIIYYDISDHLPIFMISLSNAPIIREKVKFKMQRKETKLNIESLNYDLSKEEWQTIYTETDVNNAYKNFSNKVHYYYNKNIPLNKIRVNKKTSKHPWITRGIIKSICTRNSLYKNALRHSNIENRQKYTRYRNKLTSIIRLSKTLYYSQKLKENKDNTRSLWQTINTILGRQKETHNTNEFTHNGQTITDPEQIANEFNTYFTDIGPKLASEIHTDNGHYSQYLPKSNVKSLYFNPTNVHEIIEIVKKLKSSKSRGYDELSVHLLKQIIHHIASPLSHIFNLSLSSGIFPDLLKIAKIIPIYKKDDPSQIVNYRPISLLPSISKILEKIVYNRLYSFLIKNNILIPHQYGFRKNFSTDYAILQLTDQIIESLAKKQHVIGVFMDLSKAFDTINHYILLRKLRSYGVRGNVLSWFEDYLRNRRQFVHYKSASSQTSTVLCGVPQGSILGPLLFLIYVNDIINSAPFLSYVLFADDTNVFYSHTDLNSLITTLNSELVKLSCWFKCNKLSLNINKTNCIYFRNNNSRQNALQQNILIDGLPLVEKEFTKFLGVTIDSQLNWKNHIDRICTSASRGVGILNKLKHFFSRKTLYMLYNALVFPYMSYCNTVWGNSNKTQIQSLLLLQKRALRICTSSHYLSHTDPFFYQLKTLKIDDVHTFQTAIFMFKFSKKLLPSTFQNIFTYNSNIHSYPTRHSLDIHLNNPKILLAHRSIRHHGPDIWNSLPDNIKLSSSLYSFKALMKKHLLIKYSLTRIN